MPTEISKGLVVETVGDIMDRPRLILGYDTETTGLPLWNDPSDDPRQPHVIQLGMILCDVDGKEIDRVDTLVKPGAGAVMSPEALDAHGISLERAMDEGISPVMAVDMFLDWVDRSFLRVAHNESFDRRLMRIMAARHKGFKWETDQPNFCTLYKSVGILKLPPTPAMVAAGMRGYKKPNLGECIEGFFGEKLEGAHDAMNDITATMRVFWHLVRDHGVPMIKGDAPATPIVQSDNDRVRIGGNMPPEEIGPELTPYEQHKQRIESLYEEARNWLDGDPIETAAIAGEVGKLKGMLQEAWNEAEAARVEEKRPHDEAAKAVQDRYNPLIKKGTGLVAVAVDVCNKALAPYLKKLDDEQRAEAAKLKEEADAAAAAAREKARLAAQTASLDDREAAEAAIDEAKALLKDAKYADKAKPQTGGFTKNIGLRSVYTAELTDPKAALAHFRLTEPAALKQWMREMGQKQLNASANKAEASIPGFVVKHDRIPT